MIDEVENTWDRINSNDIPCEMCRLIIVFFSWRYKPPLGVVFYSILVGSSLLTYEVS